MNKIARNLQIDIIMDNHNEIISWFNELCDNINVINIGVYNRRGKELIYYNNVNKFIFYLDLEEGDFWCDQELYWNILVNRFKLSYIEAQEVTQFLFYNRFNLSDKQLYPICATLGSQCKLNATLTDYSLTMLNYCLLG